jgi:PAS domain-containing protein
MNAVLPMLSSVLQWQVSIFSASPYAAALIGESQNVVELAALGTLTAGLALTFINLNRSRRKTIQVQRRVGELEVQLNEVESALYSECQVVLVWRGQDENPHRLAGDMHGAADIPETLEAIANFAAWLEEDSADEIRLNSQALRQTGRAFNIGVKTNKGELLEVDGRPAGANATLRIRPLAGDRRQMTELSYDATKLAKQVQRLSAILDAAPFAAWIIDKDNALAWVNQTYVQISEAPDMQAVLREGAKLFAPDQIDSGKAHKPTSMIGRGRAVTKGTMRAYNVHERAIEGGVVGYAIDISALEDAERELERHIKAHASTLDKLETAIAIFGPDQRLRFFNQAYVALWSLDEAWLKTQPSDSENSGPIAHPATFAGTGKFPRVEV